MLSELWRRTKQYLLENWGAPFILVFIVLLTVSAIYLNFGDSSIADRVALYAFYAFGLGIVLQIASYVRYGRSERKKREYVPSAPTYPRIRLTRKNILAIIVIIIVLLAYGVGAFYYKQHNSQTTSSNTTSSQTTASTRTTIEPLKIGIAFVTFLAHPTNSVELLLGINQTGGLRPFNYTAYWSDGVNQTNGVGVFIRAFLSNQSIPTYARVFVTSSDGQHATLVAIVPPVNRTTITSTTITSTSTESIPEITFDETGLPSGSVWSVSVSGSPFHSNNSKIVFNYPANATLSYAISGPYDSKNFSWAFVPAPQSGSLRVNGSTRISVSFSNQSISTPSNQILTLVGPIVASTEGAHSEQIQVEYHNAFPAQVQAIVFATVTNIESGALSVTTATTSLNAFENGTVILVFAGLSSGNYTVSLVAQYSNGVILSRAVNSTFALP